MRCAAALSTIPEASSAIAEVCEQIEEALPGGVDLAFCFIAPQHGPRYEPLLAEIDERLRPGTLLGSTGESIVATRREIEESPAIAIWSAQLPQVRARPMHVQFALPPEGGTFTGWPEDLPATWSAESALLALAEPFSFPADAWLERLNDDQPGVPVLGGMASGGHRPGENRVFLGREAFDSGAVAVLVEGNVRVEPVVSQGCRPIGAPWVITKAERNMILELGGRPPLGVFHELFETLSSDEQTLVQQGLHVGRVVDPCRDTFASGDFLIRNVIGADRQSGAIAVGDFVRAGQTVQFHVRDAHSADAELRRLLERHRAASFTPAGALVFTCNGRGTRLFPTEHHDAGAIADIWGDLPTAGLFAQGEMGPVGGRNFLHGFTASIALVGPRR